jgi:hypothetical protein
MSGSSLRRFAVTGLIITFGLLPLSTAHAAPAADQTATLSQWVRDWGFSLLQAFHGAVGHPPDSLESMTQDQDHDNGSDPHDGVGIDPNGRPRG